jgi:hypothetical protein
MSKYANPNIANKLLKVFVLLDDLLDEGGGLLTTIPDSNVLLIE